MQIIHAIAILHLPRLNDTPQEKWIDCAVDDATLIIEHFGQYKNFNLHTPITSGMKSKMDEVLVPATADFSIQKTCLQQRVVCVSDMDGMMSSANY